MEVSLAPASTRVWTEIRIRALQHNLRTIQAQIGADAQIIAVVKADAYGHGMELVLPAIQEQTAIFAVANVTEAQAVRALSREKPVMILGACLPDERATALAMDAMVTISDLSEARAFSKIAGPSHPVHFVYKIDTGMGRIGALPDGASSELQSILSLPHMKLHSVSTHLSSADSDHAFSQHQLRTFSMLMDELRTWIPCVKCQALNSAGIIGFEEHAFDFVRAGLAVYGVAPISDFQARLEPALTWKSRVVQIRDLPEGWSISYGRRFVTETPKRVAVVAAGYADGYPRQVIGKGAFVLIQGRRCAILGVVTMDQIIVDLTDVDAVEPGAEVVLLGSQGAESIDANQIANWADTIPWHVFTGIGKRTQRIADRS
jgi:alanine racemase